MGRILGRGRYIFGTYSETGSSGGPGAASVPLSRQRFIDGDTAQLGLNGSVADPFKTIAQFMASRTNASVDDATANYVGWLMPALTGYTESVAFPPYVSTELRADSISLIGGTVINGNLTWPNIAGANAASEALVSVHNIIVGGDFTVTDDVNAPTSVVVFSGDEVRNLNSLLGGTFDSSTCTKLALVAFQGAGVGNINTGTTTTSAGVLLLESTCNGTIVALGITAIDSDIGASAITLEATTGVAQFVGCRFASAPVLTALNGALFDGTSWRSFMEAGGTRAAGTFVLVVGGYSAGSVEGAALTGASTNVSLNGTGATAGYTGENSGNHYSSASDTPTTVVLKTGGGELPGDTMLITRTTLGTGALAVQNNAAATIGTIPVNARGFVLAQFNGSDWVFAEGGSMLA
jgi:hypothetical protein